MLNLSLGPVVHFNIFFLFQIKVSPTLQTQDHKASAAALCLWNLRNFTASAAPAASVATLAADCINAAASTCAQKKRKKKKAIATSRFPRLAIKTCCARQISSAYAPPGCALSPEPPPRRLHGHIQFDSVDLIIWVFSVWIGENTSCDIPVTWAQVRRGCGRRRTRRRCRRGEKEREREEGIWKAEKTLDRP